MINQDFKSMFDLLKAFPSDQSCIDHLTELRWGNSIISPFDSESKVYVCKGNKYKCKSTGKYFNVKTATLFDNTKIELQKWFLAIWIVTAHKKGISSLQLSHDIDVTQKTAWFMLQRIRKCLGVENNNDLEGTVEADETFVGGKNKNRHKDKKVKNSQGRSFKDKVPVLGVLQRSKSEIIERPHKVIPNRIVKEKIIHEASRITAIVVKNTKRSTIQPLILKYVKKGSHFMSDEWTAYIGLNKTYKHSVIDHSKKEYVNIDDNTIHTNSIEGAWKILKNSVRDTYNWVSKKHLQMYVNEFVYRYNTRESNESIRFNLLLQNTEFRLTYKELIK